MSLDFKCFQGWKSQQMLSGPRIRLRSVERRTLSSLIAMTEAPTGKHEDNLALKFSRRTLRAVCTGRNQMNVKPSGVRS